MAGQPGRLPPRFIMRPAARLPCLREPVNSALDITQRNSAQSLLRSHWQRQRQRKRHKGELMREVPTTCEKCRRFVSGEVSQLTLTNGKYLCAVCLKPASPEPGSRFRSAQQQLRSAAQTVSRTAKKLNDSVAPKVPPKTEDNFKYYCTSCSSSTNDAQLKGSGWIEIILWLCYLIPGIIYSIWRRSGNRTVCPKCSQSTLVASAERTHVRCPDCRELVLREARKCKHCGSALVPQ